MRAGASYVPISGSLKTADGLAFTSLFLPYCLLTRAAEKIYCLKASVL